MTTPMTSNPALLDPRRTLTDAQRRALKLLDAHARPAVMTRDGWQVGLKGFSLKTGTKLREHGLARFEARRLYITQTGRFCVERMEAKR